MSTDWSPPENVTLKEVKINVEDIEPILRGLESPLLKVDYPPRYLDLPGGEKMVIRRAKKEEAPIVMKTAHRLFDRDTDFYDIVSARVYAEFLGWYRNRYKDHVALVGVINGELAAIANFRLYDDTIASSLHTLTFKRRAGIGAAMFAAKTEYVFDYMKCKEWWVTYESYTGFRYWGVKYAQYQKPYPQMQHELGGGRIFFNTKDDWDRLAKPLLLPKLGTRPVPAKLLASAAKFTEPKEVEV
jgi:hypothetical protein